MFSIPDKWVNPPEPIEFQGVTYELRPVTQATENQFREWLEGKPAPIEADEPIII